MKTIGILGGMSSVSTQIYYKTLCDLTQQYLGGLHSPELLIRSLDFAVVEALQTQGDWRQAGIILNREAKLLQQAGADMLVLATNTMHKVAHDMMQGVTIPLIHIADATAHAIVERGLKFPALMATRFTMEQDFYINQLKSAGLAPMIPDVNQRDTIHRIIYEELCKNTITASSQDAYVTIAKDLVTAGADCVILGCTEICMLLNDHNVDVPVFDSTAIHCDVALRRSLS